MRGAIWPIVGALWLTTQAAGRPDDNPIFKMSWDGGKPKKAKYEKGEEGEDKQAQIKYWSGKEILVATGSTESEKVLLSKKGLGPVAVMLNLAMARGRLSPQPRSEVYFGWLLKLAHDLKDSSAEFMKLIANECKFKEELGMFESVRSRYLMNIREIRQRRFHAGNPVTLYWGSNPQKWKREDAVKLGTLQVKCGILQLFSQEYAALLEAKSVLNSGELDGAFKNLERAFKNLKNFISSLQGTDKALLDAKIGNEDDLFEKMLKDDTSGWTVKKKRGKRSSNLDGMMKEVKEFVTKAEWIRQNDEEESE